MSYTFSWFAAPALAGALISFLLCLFVVSRGPKVRMNIIFGVLMLTFVFWDMAEFLFRSYKWEGSIDGVVSTFHQNVTAQSLSICFNALFPAVILHFTFVYPVDRVAEMKRPYLIFLIYIPSLVICLATLFFNQIFSETVYSLVMTSTGSQSLVESNYFTILKYSVIVLFYTYLITSLVNLILLYKNNDETTIRKQLRFLMISLTVVIFYTFTQLMMGHYGSESLMTITIGSDKGDLTQVMDSFLTILLSLIFAIAVLKYNLLDIEFILKKSILFSGVSLGLVVIFIVVEEAMEGWIGSLGGVGSFRQYAGVIAAFVVVGTFTPLKALMKKGTDRLFPESRFLDKEYQAKLNAYRTTSIAMWADGDLSQKEANALENLRSQLDIYDSDHLRIQNDVSEKVKLRMAHGGRYPRPTILYVSRAGLARRRRESMKVGEKGRSQQPQLSDAGDTLMEKIYRKTMRSEEKVQPVVDLPEDGDLVKSLYSEAVGKVGDSQVGKDDRSDTHSGSPMNGDVPPPDEADGTDLDSGEEMDPLLALAKEMKVDDGAVPFNPNGEGPGQEGETAIGPEGEILDPADRLERYGKTKGISKKNSGDEAVGDGLDDKGDEGEEDDEAWVL